MTVADLPRDRRHGLAVFVRRVPQVHLGIAVVGNTLFVTGSVLFIAGLSGVGVYFFLVGSSGMFLGSVGELVRAVGRRTLKTHDIDPWYPDHSWSERLHRQDHDHQHIKEG